MAPHTLDDWENMGVNWDADYTLFYVLVYPLWEKKSTEKIELSPQNGQNSQKKQRNLTHVTKGITGT